MDPCGACQALVPQGINNAETCLTEISGVAGAHVMAFGYERGIPEILERAGIGTRPDQAVTTHTPTTDGSGRAG